MRCWQLKALLPTVLAVIVVLPACPATAKPRQSLQPYMHDRTVIFTSGKIVLGIGLGLLPGLASGVPASLASGLGHGVASTLNLATVGLGLAEFIAKIIAADSEGSSISTVFDSVSRQHMLALFAGLSKQLDEMTEGLQGIDTTLHDLVRGLPDELRWQRKLNSLEEDTRTISSLHQHFTFYQNRSKNIEEHTLRDFASNVVGHGDTSVHILMSNIHSMVAPGAPNPFRSLSRSQTRTFLGSDLEHSRFRSQSHRGDPSRSGIFFTLETVLKKYHQCDSGQSHQQMMMELYWMIAIAQAKGYSMITYAHMLLRSYGIGNFTVEQEKSRVLYDHYSLHTMLEALAVLRSASGTYSRCDPKEHVLGETYVMFTELLQGHIENEVDMNVRGSCTSNCAGYQHAKVHGCYMPELQVCGLMKKCHGTVHNCQFFNSWADVCFSAKPYRRYEWVHYYNKTDLGTKGTCEDEKELDLQIVNFQRVYSWNRWFVHCSYCFCLCDDPSSSTSDRYVSLLPSVTDVEDGMVLTGVKISKHKRVVRIEVQQGRAMPQGQVDSSTLSWVALPDIDIKSSSSRPGHDYHILSYEDRSMNLNPLRAPIGYVVTGTRFRLLSGELILEIRVTPIDFELGVPSSKHFWINHSNMPVMGHVPRQELSLYKPDDPTKHGIPSKKDSTDNMFVKFQATDLHADAAQLTVPFLDAQPVTTFPASWISGLHLFHKGRRGSGGFVALELECYNTTRHFQEALVASN